MSFEVLAVCLGNICRSPALERLLRARLDGTDVVASSAGVGAVVGRPIDPPVARALSDLGVSIEGHRARQVQPAMIDGAGLVLALDSEVRRAVLQLRPAALRRVFTLKEFARLAAGVPSWPDGLDERVRAVAARRGMVDPAGPGVDDVADPIGRGPDVARACVAEIDRATAVVTSVLTVPPSS